VSKPKVAHSRLDRLKALPWAVLLQVGVAFSRRLGALSSRDRKRLTGLLRSSGGWPGRLSANERRELLALVGKLDLLGMLRELPWFAGRRRPRGRR
jgi:hypothetical protein